FSRDWSSDVCSSDLSLPFLLEVASELFLAFVPDFFGLLVADAGFSSNTVSTAFGAVALLVVFAGLVFALLTGFAAVVFEAAGLAGADLAVALSAGLVAVSVGAAVFVAAGLAGVALAVALFAVFGAVSVLAA